MSFLEQTCFDVFINLFHDTSEKLTVNNQIVSITQSTFLRMRIPLVTTIENFRKVKDWAPQNKAI